MSADQPFHVRLLARLRPPQARFRMLAAVGLVGLALLGGSYWLTHERAPAIRVRWRDALPVERQAELEQRYGLANRRAPMEDAPLSLAYDLLNTSRRNVRRLVQNPDVADTNDIDREQFRVRPLTNPGERWMWLGDRTLGLGNPPVVWALIALLAVAAVTGLRGMAMERRRLIALGLLVPPAESGDLFDRLPSRWRWLPAVGTETPPRRLVRLLAVVFVVAAIGLPVIETWRVLLLALAALAILFGAGRSGGRRIAQAAAIVLVVVAVKAMLPRADIAEGHNAFFVLGDGEPLQQALPPEVFRSWRARFEQVYPPQAPPYTFASWRYSSTIPKGLFTRSTDALWRPAKYTRQVDHIAFDNLAEFRGGFANEGLYNFWNGDIGRETMPFFAMYELTPATVGSGLTWKGQLFWERADGGFDEVVHDAPTSRRIESADAGKRVYALFLPAREEHLQFSLEPSLPLRLSGWADRLFTVLAVSAVVGLLVRIRWADYLRAVTTFAVGYRLIILAMSLSGAWYLGQSYLPHGGGNDGLVHDGLGRTMALLARDGHVVEALKGEEAVYWFTPGMRYVRMLEKLVFGDTNHLYALLLAGVPLIVFYLLRHFVRLRWAWTLTALFCAMPVGNLSLLQYVMNARLGYAEACGCALFLLGLVLLLRSQPSWGGTAPQRPLVWAAGVALAVAMFVRPNFALSVVWVAAAWTWASWRRRDIGAIAALAGGLALALWMPFHNWYYGGEFFLISRAGATISVPLGVGDYVAAGRDLWQGKTDTAAAAVVWKQISGWLSGPAFVDLYSVALMPLAWVAHGLRILGLIVSCWVALRWIASRCRTGTSVAVIAIAAIGAQVPMLVVHATFDRYAMLGWDLSLVVLIVWLARLFSVHAAAPSTQRGTSVQHAY